MSSSTTFFEKLKFHNYSIITAIIIGILVAIYLMIIVPNNEAKEDANNLAIFKGVEGQLKSYIDDKLQGVSSEQMETIYVNYSKRHKISKTALNSGYYIDKIKIKNLVRKDLLTKKLELTRTIYFKKKDGKKKDTISVLIVDIVKFDLKDFIKRINSSSNFKSFFICPVTLTDKKEENDKISSKQIVGFQNINVNDNQNISSEKQKKEQSKASKCLASEALISQNVNLMDEDSLCFYNRNSSPITFKESNFRYYKGQVRIPDTDFTLFFAAGINSSFFQSNVNYIKPNHLILGLLITVLLFLSVFLIKPIVMSYKELLSQMDLIRVVFSIGALIAILVIFGMVGFWKTAVSNRNKSDLKQLVCHIDSSFTNQINTLQGWRDNDSKISLINGDSLKSKSVFDKKIKKEKRISEIKVLNTVLAAKSFNTADSLKQLKLLDDYFLVNKYGFLSPRMYMLVNPIRLLYTKDSFTKQLKFLDAYFWMNKEGLLTASLDRDSISFPRKFNDRDYFKLLQNKEINTVLTVVFSREKDEFQWIYAEKVDKVASSEKFAIKGIAFREQFSKEIKLSPDTDYMLVDRAGTVLTQYNPYNLNNSPYKKLYQNVLIGSNNNLVLASVLAGCDIPNFRMDYQGKSYQVYAKKLSVLTDLPVYILGIRDLSYIDYLSQFTFINAILIVLAYGLLIVLIILVYSSFFHSGHIGFFARDHFFHLFHDYSKKDEYKNLLIMNCICFLIALLVFLFSTPITALYFSLLISLNITFINVVILNINHSIFKFEYKKFYFLVFFLSFAFPLILFWFDFLYMSLAVIIVSHIGFILYYRKWKNIDKFKEKPKEKILQRKAYLRFLTSGLINHFVLFPFILVCVFYSNEINDNARYYCSPSQPSVTNNAYLKKVNVYGCGCNIQEPLLNLGRNNEGFIRKLNFGFKDPTTGVVKNYTINGVSKSFYIMLRIIFTEAGSNFVFIILGFLFVLLLAYSLLNYYSNRFFFFDLMQISYTDYYPLNKGKLTEGQSFIEGVFDSGIKNPKTFRNGIQNKINAAFEKDKKFEVIPFFRNEFMLNSELKYFDESYSTIWRFISKKESEIKEPEEKQNTQMQNVLFDFAQDHFSNYKNKDIIMELMDLGLINHNESTGRLQIRSESFRRFILLKSRQDAVFVEEFKKDSANGTFDKLRIPMLIIATSLLILLMYLNKDRYNQIEIMGTSITSVIVLVNRFLSMGKT